MNEANEPNQDEGAKNPRAPKNLTKRYIGKGKPLPLDDEHIHCAPDTLSAPLGKWDGTLGTDGCETDAPKEPAPTKTQTRSIAQMSIGDSTHTDTPGKPAPGNHDATERSTPQSDTIAGAEGVGDVPPQPSSAGLLSGEPQPVILTFSREGETRAACWERIRKEARLAGLPRGQGPGTAYEFATREVERLFPPKVKPIPEIPVEPEIDLSTKVDIEPAPTIVDVEPAPTKVDSEPDSNEVSGLGDLPESWGTLPANASMQVEIAWVNANRLRVRSGSGVDLSRALSPAPSYSALSWLETSILFPSKFADISVKATAGQEDEREHVRREKLAIEEIRSLLAEMLEG
jgi:hypothetical protein